MSELISYLIGMVLFALSVGGMADTRHADDLSDHGIEQYANLSEDQLQRIAEIWTNDHSQ